MNWYITNHSVDRMVERFPHLLSTAALSDYSQGIKKTVKLEMVRLTNLARPCKQIQGNARYLSNIRSALNNDVEYHNVGNLVMAVQSTGRYIGYDQCVVTILDLNEMLETNEARRSPVHKRQKPKTVPKRVKGKIIYERYF